MFGLDLGFEGPNLGLDQGLERSTFGLGSGLMGSGVGLGLCIGECSLKTILKKNHKYLNISVNTSNTELEYCLNETAYSFNIFNNIHVRSFLYYYKLQPLQT